MSKELKQTIQEYIAQTRWAVLTTVREDSAPVSRAIGSFAPDGLDVYFSTPPNTGKARHLAKNPWVNFFFQHEGQELAAFKNVAIVGQAKPVKEGADWKRAVELLSARNPRFKAKADAGDLKDTAIYKITTKEAKYLDFAKGFGKDAIQEITL